jgi:uncharacterized protein
MRSARLLLLLVIALAPTLGAAAPEHCLVAAARQQVGVTTRYDGRYAALAYPGGDVPLDRGVCTDVVVRAFRALGVDLQRLVHEDMSAAWDAYPKLWNLRKPDRNIDHRRVPNLAVYFQRHGRSFGATRDPAQFRAGDIVTWRLSSGVPHIGVVSDRRGLSGVPLIIHNIGAGVQEEDVLFAHRVTGHYRYELAARSGRPPTAGGETDGCN